MTPADRYVHRLISRRQLLGSSALMGAGLALGATARPIGWLRPSSSIPSAHHSTSTVADVADLQWPPGRPPLFPIATPMSIGPSESDAQIHYLTGPIGDLEIAGAPTVVVRDPGVAGRRIDRVDLVELAEDYDEFVTAMSYRPSLPSSEGLGSVLRIALDPTYHTFQAGSRVLVTLTLAPSGL